VLVAVVEVEVEVVLVPEGPGPVQPETLPTSNHLMKTMVGEVGAEEAERAAGYFDFFVFREAC
jgi:hypothetical protein